MFTVHHVQIAIPEGGEDEARRFYGEVLGLEEVDKPTALAAQGGAWFRNEHLEVHLEVDQDFQPGAIARPGFLVDDLELVASRIGGAGFQVRPDSQFPGHRRFDVEDPFGNPLAFLQADD